MKLVPVQNMSGAERKRTPFPFAMYLVQHVQIRCKCDRVAVLWTMKNSVYWRLFPFVEIWGIDKDANTYPGPYPIVAHPPCGPWGCLKWSSKESKDHGIRAMELVHQWGGVVEQPLGSSLFRDYGRGGTVSRVNQCDFGHRGLKPTILYWSF